MTPEERAALKRQAAEHAVQQVQSGTRLGLGTGSTVRYVLEALARRLHAGALHDVVGVPTSLQTERLAHDLGIPTTTLEAQPQLDVTIDGADEVGPGLSLIKGLGGALLREKIVASASARFVVVVDASKCVRTLGTHAPLPVEVLPFGWLTHLPLLNDLGAQASLRTLANGQPFLTDNGNYILDSRFPTGIPDLTALLHALDARTGVIEHGLFVTMTTTVYVGNPDGVVQLWPDSPPEPV